MGLFGPSAKYSKIEHYLTEIEIKKLVSHERVQSVDSKDALIVESAIIARRHGDGKISLQQIYETLLQLKNQGKISKYDKDGVMRVFENYFKEKFGDA